MVVTIRLYWRHDLDLLSIAGQEGVSIKQLFKDALIACSSGNTAFHVEVPEDIIKKIGGVPTDSRLVHFSLNPKKPDEKKAIDYLLSIRRGCRNMTLKIILRYYLDTPCLYASFNNPSDYVRITAGGMEPAEGKNIPDSCKDSGERDLPEPDDVKMDFMPEKGPECIKPAETAEPERPVPEEKPAVSVQEPDNGEDDTKTQFDQFDFLSAVSGMAEEY